MDVAASLASTKGILMGVAGDSGRLAVAGGRGGMSQSLKLSLLIHGGMRWGWG